MVLSSKSESARCIDRHDNLPKNHDDIGRFAQEPPKVAKGAVRFLPIQRVPRLHQDQSDEQ